MHMMTQGTPHIIYDALQLSPSQITCFFVLIIIDIINLWSIQLGKCALFLAGYVPYCATVYLHCRP